MYVIFPAEEVVDFTLGIISNAHLCPHHQQLLRGPEIKVDHPKKENPKVGVQEKQVKIKKRNQKLKQQQEVKMATGGEVTLRDLTHPSLNESLKAHNSVTFKLVRTVSDFTQQLSQVYEQHAEELQLLVSNFRKRNAELRKERPACPSSLFHTWETLLQVVEVDSQAHTDIASTLGRQVARPLLERSFHRKIQSRKVFTHRESYETILAKAEDKLAKYRQEYKNAYLAYMSNPSTAGLAAYLDSHNNYVQQLHATNGMLDQYNQETLPQLLQELEDVYSDLCTTLSESVLQGSEIIATRAMEQSQRYESLSGQCRAVLATTDLAHFVRSLNGPHHSAPRHNFAPPQPPPPPEIPDGPNSAEAAPAEPAQNAPPPLKNEIVVDRLASMPVRSRYDALRQDSYDLDTQIKQLQDALDTLLRIQQRSLESNLFNKANELQEDISMKRFDLRVAQIHLGAVRAQKELFASKIESASDSSRERKMSSSSTGSMKNKWLKAFKSLKTGSTNGAEKKNQMYHAVSTIMTMRKNGRSSERQEVAPPTEGAAHMLQEYTYKKITPCDVCSQVLRGHTRQGLKCRVCKANVHADCQERLGRCQPKSRLLRRQKSTSEIETRALGLPEEETSLDGSTASGAAAGPGAAPTLIEPQEIDLIYQVLKQAGEIRGGAGRDAGRRSLRSGTSLAAPHASSSDMVPMQDSHRRRHIFAGMKSLSTFSRSIRADAPGHSRSISLPESRGPGSAAGTRPFGQPLCLSDTINENGSVNGNPLKQKTKRFSK